MKRWVVVGVAVVGCLSCVIAGVLFLSSGQSLPLIGGRGEAPSQKVRPSPRDGQERPSQPAPAGQPAAAELPATAPAAGLSRTAPAADLAAIAPPAGASAVDDALAAADIATDAATADDAPSPSPSQRVVLFSTGHSPDSSGTRGSSTTSASRGSGGGRKH